MGAQVRAAGLKLMIVQSLGLPLRLSQCSVDDSHAAGHVLVGEDEDLAGALGTPTLDQRVLGCKVLL